MEIAGLYIERFNELTGQNIPCGSIYQSDGLYAHVVKRHPECVSLMGLIPSIISAPDYIGHHPREPQSVELVKCVNGNLMVCIKLDTKRNFLYVASFFEISEAKIENRLSSGRLVEFY